MTKLTMLLLFSVDPPKVFGLSVCLSSTISHSQISCHNPQLSCHNPQIQWPLKFTTNPFSHLALLFTFALLKCVLLYSTLLCFVTLPYFVKAIFWTTGQIFKLQKRKFLKILSGNKFLSLTGPFGPLEKNIIPFLLSTLPYYT